MKVRAGVLAHRVEVTTLLDISVMLPAHLVADNGLKIIKEYPELTGNLRLHVGD